LRRLKLKRCDRRDALPGFGHGGTERVGAGLLTRVVPCPRPVRGRRTVLAIAAVVLVLVGVVAGWRFRGRVAHWCTVHGETLTCPLCRPAATNTTRRP